MTQPTDSNDGDGTARDSFPIVAVGASAGGLVPTIELLRELGPRPEIGIVVIHHLDPTPRAASSRSSRAPRRCRSRATARGWNRTTSTSCLPTPAC